MTSTNAHRNHELQITNESTQQKVGIPKKSQKRNTHIRRGKTKKVQSLKKKVSVTHIQHSTHNQQYHRRKTRVLNPFRQEDEEEVLAKRTHNRRRWSHVFPQGEIEFKRHAGPNWKSLCQPAILPITIDMPIPSTKELNDPLKFQMNHYSITLDAMDFKYYKSHADLLMDMVRLRLTQDFQLVPPNTVRQTKESRCKDRHGEFVLEPIRFIILLQPF